MPEQLSLEVVQARRPLSYTVFIALAEEHPSPWETIGAKFKSDRRWDREIQWLRRHGLVRHDPKNAKHISWVLTESGERMYEALLVEKALSKDK